MVDLQSPLTLMSDGLLSPGRYSCSILDGAASACSCSRCMPCIATNAQILKDVQRGVQSVNAAAAFGRGTHIVCVRMA